MTLRVSAVKCKGSFRSPFWQTMRSGKVSYKDAIGDINKHRAVQALIGHREVSDRTFSTPGEDVALSSFFGSKDLLFVIHNIGKSCVHCTQWADSRNWNFTMVSHSGTRFAQDMGCHPEEGYWRGVSVFKKEDGRLLRATDANFDLGDDFNAVWNLFDLVSEGPGGRETKHSCA